MQSTCQNPPRRAPRRPAPARGPRGLHVAIILDGNGRWAEARELPRRAGHWAGVEVVRSVVAAAPGLGIGTLTLYALSSDNWKRPRAEVRSLLALLEDYLRRETLSAAGGIRLRVIGRRDRLPRSLAAAIAAAERATAFGRRLELRIALDYSARGAILAAARRLARAPEGARRAAFGRLIARASHAGSARDVDLLIRSGGERRLSDFLLWECAYAELYFSPVPWPDWTPAHLEEALRDFRGRERRFGALPAAGRGAAARAAPRGSARALATSSRRADTLPAALPVVRPRRNP
ncbi:MAG TPA: polyprenyl diphosphate synthase [Candidatus Eisenbacteria bacterium]